MTCKIDPDQGDSPDAICQFVLLYVLRSYFLSMLARIVSCNSVKNVLIYFIRLCHIFCM